MEEDEPVCRRRNLSGGMMYVALNGDLHEKMEYLIYLGSKLIVDGGIETAVKC